ncbi:hypothetical protein C922_05580 [Plasmodium inui San Antonio 1]|uniref:Uncharacterized protein n=1 Tax=Plasmodium inui San Antonio 1 TaxID=1237626 RepID=W7AFI6_9APIC|nr:hypothetical protein C922_05580 [Plasmodium inui San Antonio 1]EUD64036.1 hypothetical protein C922_05580 [Plasmodium inui San Antonio 1]
MSNIKAEETGHLSRSLQSRKSSTNLEYFVRKPRKENKFLNPKSHMKPKGTLPDPGRDREPPQNKYRSTSDFGKDETNKKVNLDRETQKGGVRQPKQPLLSILDSRIRAREKQGISGSGSNIIPDEGARRPNPAQSLSKAKE